MAWIELDLSTAVCYESCEFSSGRVQGNSGSPGYNYAFTIPAILLVDGMSFDAQIDLAEGSHTVECFSQSGLTFDDFNFSEEFSVSDPTSYEDRTDLTTYDFTFTPTTTADALAGEEPYVVWWIRQTSGLDNAVVAMRVSELAETGPPVFVDEHVRARVRFWGQR